MRLSKLCLLLVVIVASSVVLSACGSATMSQASKMPAFLDNAPENVRTAYQFAMDHPKDLAKYPCYCGCGNMGHQSNFNCYIKEIAPNGDITFDDHASNCGVCADITTDVMRLMKDGQSAPKIRQYIDAHYSQFGPSTNTAFPTE